MVLTVLTTRLTTYTNDIAVTVNLRAQVRENDAERSPRIRIDNE